MGRDLVARWEDPHVEQSRESDLRIFDDLGEEGWRYETRGMKTVERDPISSYLHCAWQLLLQCAGTRCHHVLKTVQPFPISQVCRRTRRKDVPDHDSTVGLGALPRSQEQIATALLNELESQSYRKGPRLC